MNLKMPDLKAALEAAGFANVKTLLSSGNVAFDARKASEEILQKKVEEAVEKAVGRHFMTIVRAQDDLVALIESDRFSAWRLRGDEKKVVTFLRDDAGAALNFPITGDGGRILGREDKTVYTAYVPGTKGAGFMGLLEKTFTKNITTRTWDTVRKCSLA